MNLLETKKGRRMTFGVLYFSEGLPQGFAAVALALEFRRQGMDGAAIGAFAGIILIPWSFKFLAGPLVDNLHLRRFGRRKQWIVLAQTGMLLTLGVALLHMPEVGAGGLSGLGLFTFLMLLHNVFAATQDVAIDALACSVLPRDERGVANGVMFGAAQAGQAIGGAGVIALKDWLGGFGPASLLVPGLLILILTVVAVFLSERSYRAGHAGSEESEGRGLAAVAGQIRGYLRTACRTLLGTRNGRLGIALAIIPTGGLALSMVVSTLIAPTLGMRDGEIARLNLVCTAVWMSCCLFGGWLSDRFGRRLSLGVFGAMSVVPGLWIAWRFHEAGWSHPMAAVDGEWPRHEHLIGAWWVASIWFSVFHGFLYSVRTALFMDLVTPRIAATQFTALMAVSNLVLTYTAIWQARAFSVDAWNWPVWTIFTVDALAGLAFLGILPFLNLDAARSEVR
jgi:PAT family beta-lactamase induction signal transducer AmpG